jgi:uncharacterized protein
MIPGLPPLSGRVGDVIHRLAGWIDRRRREILIVSLVVLVAAGFLARRLPIRSDITHLLPPTTPSVVALHQLEARIPTFGTILVVAEGKDPARRARAGQLLAKQLRGLDPELVTQVVADDRDARDFVWQNRFLFADLADLKTARDALDDEIRRGKLASNPLYVDLEEEDEKAPSDARGAQPDGTAELRRKLADARAKHDGTPGLVSRDGTMQLLVVRTTFSNSELTLADRLVADLEARMDAVQREVGPSVTISAQGDVYTALAEHRALTRGVLIATLLTVTVVAAGLLLYFRSVVALAALFFSLAVGTVATFAFTRLTIGHLNLATAFLSSIVVGNGINFGLILLARFLEERRAGKCGVEAIGAAMAGTMAGTLTAALTASVAYASLTITSFEGFRHFGIIGGVGMIACWAAAYLILPAGLAVLERRGLAVRRHEPALGRVVAWFLPRRPLPVAFFALALTVVAGAAAYHFVVNDPLEKSMKNLLSDSDELVTMRERLHRVHEAFSWDTTGIFILAAPDRATARDVVAKMRAVDQGVAPGRRLFSKVESLDDFLPRDQAAKLTLLADVRHRIDDALPDLDDADRAELLELRPPDSLHALGEQDVPTSIATPYTEKDGTRGRLVVAHARKGLDPDDIPTLISFTAAVRALQLGDGVIVGGSMFVFADVLEHMQSDGPRATVVALLGAILVVLLLVGGNRHGVITLVCCVSGTALMLACAWLLGLKGNVLDFIALPITIGIGIDYSVNIVTRVRREGLGSAHDALRTVGGAVVVCSFTTIVGYGSLLLSANRGIRSFGTAAIVGEATCLLAALALAPALLALGRGARSPRPTRPAQPD